MGNSKTKLEIPKKPSYAQLYQLLSVATNCIKANRKRISDLETANTKLAERITKLENRGGLYILADTTNPKTT